MKKLIYMFSTLILCFAFMNDVSAANYKVCVYDKLKDNAIQGALHVVGSKVKFDMYRAGDEGFLPYIFDNKLEVSKFVYNGAGANAPTGVDSTHKALSDPNYLATKCPQQLCECSNEVFIEEGSCFGCDGGTNLGVYILKKELREADVGGLDELLAYKFGNANPSKLTYTTALNGGCPSDVPAFKLLKYAYEILKIGAPLALVVFATIDMAKAAATSDESTIKKTQKHCLKRFAAAVIVLLSFVIVEMIINIVSGGSEVMSCINQLLN